jgi:DNA-binding XRE family transcriptional regulator
MTEASNTGMPLADLVRASRLPDLAERKRIREAAGVSLRRMGEALGVTEGTIWNWENGRDGPSMENAVRYRELLDELSEAVKATP